MTWFICYVMEKFIQTALSQSEIEEIRTFVFSNVFGIINNTFRIANKIRKAAHPNIDLSSAEIIKSRIEDYFNRER